MDRAPCPLSVAGGSCAKGIPNDLTVYDTEGNPHILCKNHANKRRKMEKAAEGTGDEWVRNWLDGNTADVAATATAAAGVAAAVEEGGGEEEDDVDDDDDDAAWNASEVPLHASGAVRHAQRVNTARMLNEADKKVAAAKAALVREKERHMTQLQEQVTSPAHPSPPHPTPPHHDASIAKNRLKSPSESLPHPCHTGGQC